MMFITLIILYASSFWVAGNWSIPCPPRAFWLFWSILAWCHSQTTPTVYPTHISPTTLAPPFAHITMPTLLAPNLDTLLRLQPQVRVPRVTATCPRHTEGLNFSRDSLKWHPYTLCPAGNWVFPGAEGFSTDLGTSRWQGLAGFICQKAAGSLPLFTLLRKKIVPFWAFNSPNLEEQTPNWSS